jgi:CheY-like chemotaxis protein
MKNILYVDDDATLRRMFSRYFHKRFGDSYSLEESDCASSAITRIEQGGIDVLVTDCDMEREYSGIEMVQLLRERGFTIPMLVTSGRFVEKEALKAGADAYVSKDGSVRIIDTLELYLQRQSI